MGEHTPGPGTPPNRRLTYIHAHAVAGIGCFLAAAGKGCLHEQDPLLGVAAMGMRGWIESWPVYRQLADKDKLGLGAAVKSRKTGELRPRIAAADNVVKSVCPYCAVGCGQDVYVEDGRVTQIEGDPDSPVSRGRLCPKGSASLQLTTGDARQYQVRYRRSFGTDWEDLDLDTAMDMIADRVIAARRAGWQWEVDGARTRRTLGFAQPGRGHLGQ